MPSRLVLEWFGGSSAVVDLQSEVRKGSVRYLLRYTSPFRPTMRAPRQELPAGQQDLRQINDELDEVVTRNGASSSRDEALRELGRQIFELVLPPYVRADLRKRELFVELGTDVDLLHLPWELMHDGEEYVCLKHYVGRYVNLRRTPELNGRTLPASGSELGEPRILLVGVPNPKPRGGRQFDDLTAVKGEMQAIIKTARKMGVTCEYLGPKTTRKDFLQALRSPYHIVHFSGHAVFDAQNPSNTALVLADVNVSVGQLTSALAEQRAILYVINACETTRGAGAPKVDDETMTWREQYNIFGLARAFLDNGAYLLGSRWRLPDESAERFTKTFYDALLANGAPIGRAITMARDAVRAKMPDDFSWATYVYYGDPRLCFRVAAADLAPSGRTEPGSAPSASGLAEREGRVREVAQDYEKMRERVPPSTERTRKIAQLLAKVDPVANEELLPSPGQDPETRGQGERIVALRLLDARPDPDRFDFVLKVLENPRSGFEEYEALRAAARMLPDLPAEQEERLGALIRRRAEDPAFFGTDRHLIAGQILGRIRHDS
jgi:CHAT domain-containing protein